MSGKLQTFCLLLTYLKHSMEKMSFYQIMISEMKRSGQGQNITLTKSDWSVSLKLCSDWLGEL